MLKAVDIKLGTATELEENLIFARTWDQFRELIALLISCTVSAVAGPAWPPIFQAINYLVQRPHGLSWLWSRKWNSSVNRRMRISQNLSSTCAFEWPASLTLRADNARPTTGWPSLANNACHRPHHRSVRPRSHFYTSNDGDPALRDHHN